MVAGNAASIPEVEDQLRQGYADVRAMCHGNFGAVIASGQAALSGFQAVNSELLAFLQSRAKDGLATSQRLVECGSPETAVQVQLDYAKAALQAYVDEVGKINALTGRILVDVMAPLKSRGDVVAEGGEAPVAA